MVMGFFYDGMFLFLFWGVSYPRIQALIISADFLPPLLGELATLCNNM